MHTSVRFSLAVAALTVVIGVQLLPMLSVTEDWQAHAATAVSSSSRMTRTDRRIQALRSSSSVASKFSAGVSSTASSAAMQTASLGVRLAAIYATMLQVNKAMNIDPTVDQATHFTLYELADGYYQSAKGVAKIAAIAAQRALTKKEVELLRQYLQSGIHNYNLFLQTEQDAGVTNLSMLEAAKPTVAGMCTELRTQLMLSLKAKNQLPDRPENQQWMDDQLLYAGCITQQQYCLDAGKIADKWRGTAPTWPGCGTTAQ